MGVNFPHMHVQEGGGEAGLLAQLDEVIIWQSKRSFCVCAHDSVNALHALTEWQLRDGSL